MQYKASLWMKTVAVFLGTGIEFLGLWALFHRFKTIQGWSFDEVALFYGAVNISFTIADAMTRGFDVFSQMIKQGGFDILLLRPRSTVLQLFGYELTFRRIGRFVQGLVVFIWTWSSLVIRISFGNILITIWLIINTILVFASIFIFQGALTFKTVESLEVMNIMSYGGVFAAQYPITIYKRFLSAFFLFVIPLGAVSYIPICSLLGKPAFSGFPLWAGWLTPCCGILFFLLSLFAWQIGVKHYTSAGG